MNLNLSPKAAIDRADDLLRMLNDGRSIEDARLLAEKAILAAANEDGRTWRFEKAVEFISVMKRWPAVIERLQS